MNIKDAFKNVNPKKVVGIGMAVAAGIGAVMSSIADQKKEAELEELKKIVHEITNK